MIHKKKNKSISNVIARSETTKQSTLVNNGLLRHYVPRNDDAIPKESVSGFCKKPPSVEENFENKRFP